MDLKGDGVGCGGVGCGGVGCEGVDCGGVEHVGTKNRLVNVLMKVLSFS